MDTRARRRLPRLGLLLAVVLHLVGTAVLAPLHAAAPGGDAPAAAAQGAGEPGLPAHEAEDCAFCVALGSSALPEAAPPALTPAGSAPAARGAAPPAAPLPYAYHPPARAPPAAA